jgi:HAD superfamily hydrolase (TIGR01459 family)
MARPMPIHLDRLSSVSDRFDAAVLDQWGVLHDGNKAPEGAIDAVRAMVAAGKKLIVLSNSARLGSDACGRLVKLGYEPAWFAGVITSGETVRDMLLTRADPFFAALGRSVYLIAREPTLIEGSDYRQAIDLDDADFVLLGSSTAPEMSLEKDYAALLKDAASRGLPMVCANPDRIGIAGTGFIEGPGALAAYYEEQGGVVRYVGKPHPEVYARAAALLGGMPINRILAVGDSMEHDIAGGHAAGCPTAFVEGGIHKAELAENGGLALVCGRYGVTPDFIIPKLLW